MLRWTVDPVVAWMPRYEQYTRDLVDLAAAVVEARRDEIVEWMQANHKWENRTGLAETGLSASVIRQGAHILLIMYYSMNVYEDRPSGRRFYPYWLERIWLNSRQFSVLEPALDRFAPILLEDLRKALRK